MASKIVFLLVPGALAFASLCAAQNLGEKILAMETPKSVTASAAESIARKKSLRISKVTLCMSNSRSVRCAYVRDGPRTTEFLQPFPAAIEPNIGIAEALAGGVPDYSWSPLSFVDQGAHHLERLLQLADSKRPFDCLGESCSMAVNAIGGGGNQAVAICRALQFNSHWGPPHACVVLAVRTRSEWWMKIIDRVGEWLTQAASTQIYSIEVRGVPRSRILATINRALSDRPLALPDHHVRQDRIEAVAPRRFSQILSGRWFEWPQLFVEVNEGYNVVVSLDLLVNKQNTANPGDWHLPTDQQTDEFRRATLIQITRALNGICVRPVWEGSDRFSCTQLRAPDGWLVNMPGLSAAGGSYERPVDPRVETTLKAK